MKSQPNELLYEQNTQNRNSGRMKILLIATLFLGGCGGGLMETVALSTTANIISELVMDEVRSDCKRVE